MLGILAMACFFFCGVTVSRRLFAKEPIEIRFWLGSVLSLALMMWIPALWSFIFGFTQFTQLAAACTALIVGGISLKYWKAVSFTAKKESLLPFLACILPLFLLACYLLWTHILRPMPDGSLHTGQSCFGDLPMHLGFVTSISEQKFFPPDYSILPGIRMGYPFLCDSISSTLLTLGLPLRMAFLLPMLPAILCVLAGGYLLFRAWLKESGKTVLAFLFFFVGSGFGFAYFLDGTRANPGNFSRIFTAFYETPTNYTSQNILWVNPIVDLLVPQRATLFGWVLLFACLYLLYRAAFEGESGYFLPLGVLAGMLPLIHTHSFLALGLFSCIPLLRAVLKGGFHWKVLCPWLIYAGIALLLAMPQLVVFTFQQGSSFFKFSFNWVNHKDSYFWFYLKNIGLTYLLLIPAFLNAKSDSRWWYCGGLVILFAAEFFVFQPNEYDNNKLLMIWYLLGCGLTGGFLVDLYRHLAGMKGRVVLASLTLTICFLGGVLTFIRESVSDYEQFNADAVAAAQWVSDSTQPQDLFLTADNHNNTVAALTGRNIVCGSSSYLFFHGLDYAYEQKSLKTLFETPWVEQPNQEQIDYIYIGPYEKSQFQIDESWFASHFNLVFSQGDIKIYNVPQSDSAWTG